MCSVNKTKEQICNNVNLFYSVLNSLNRYLNLNVKNMERLDGKIFMATHMKNKTRYCKHKHVTFVWKRYFKRCIPDISFTSNQWQAMQSLLFFSSYSGLHQSAHMHTVFILYPATTYADNSFSPYKWTSLDCVLMHYCLHAADLLEDKPGTTMGSTGGGVSAMNQTITRQHYLNYIFEWGVPHRTTRIESYINHKVLKTMV